MSRTRGLSVYLRVMSRLRSYRETSAPSPDDPNAPARLAERFGEASVERPDGPLIWVHAPGMADAGWLDVFGADLVEERGEVIHLLLTTDDADGAALPGAIHQLVPTESQRAAQRFLDHWRPDAAILLNAPVRPVLVSETAERDIPLMLAATRRAETATAPRLPLLSGAVLGCFDRVLAASAADAEAFRRQGVPSERLEVTGPLTDLTTPEEVDFAEQARWVDAIAGRPVWLAASVTRAEIPVMLQAHRAASRMSHRLLLLLVPRSGTLEDAARMIPDDVQVARSDIDGSFGDTDRILLGDLDRLPLWLRLAAMSYLGGSLDPGAEMIDPYLPAALGSAIVHGPETYPRETRLARLQMAGASRRVTGPDDLAEDILRLMSPDRSAEMAHAGWSVTSEGAAALDRLKELAHLVLDGDRP